MFTFKVFHFNKDCMFIGKELISLPGVDPAACSKYMRERRFVSNLGDKADYSTLIPERGLPIMVKY